MWDSFFKPFAPTPAHRSLPTNRKRPFSIVSHLSVGTFAFGSFVFSVTPSLLWPQLAAAQAQSPAPAESPTQAPTARYAQGEDVDLAEIIAEWRGYYADIPVYLCICQDGTCDQTAQWPYREYDRYQFSVALGPGNGSVAEAAGSNCFDIADGSRPGNPREFSAEQVPAQTPTPAAPPEEVPDDAADNRPDAPPIAPPAPVAPPPPDAPMPNVPTPSAPAPSPPTPSPSSQGIPAVTVINDGADIRLDWPSGSTNVVNVTGSNWNLNVLNALDCDSLSLVDEKMMEAQRVQGTPVVDATTGHVAVPVLLDSCIEVDQMAVFILDPAEGGGYGLYRTQLPNVRGSLGTEDRAFPNEFSSYAYSTIADMRYWDSTLLVRQTSASGAEAISIFRPGPTPAGVYAGCGIVSNLEGANALCDQ